MDIEEFYDADERRRDSEELELGNAWRDASGMRYALSYVVDTGELYLMASPDVEILEDAFGDMAVDSESVEELTVEIVALVPTPDALHAALAGWESASDAPDSVTWLRSKVVSFKSP